MIKPILLLLVLVTLTSSTATTAGNLYLCIQQRKCVENYGQCLTKGVPNKDEAKESNMCLQARAGRDLCLTKNKCSFSDTDEYSQVCWHCWYGIETSSTKYQDFINCVNPCYKSASRLIIALILLIAFYV